MTQLINHCGAQEVSRGELLDVSPPAGTDTWFPIAHSTVIDAVTNTLDEAGYTITREWLSVNKQGLEFFGVLDLESQINTEVSLSVGVRNSNNKRFPIGMCCGTRCFVCDNLAFSSEVVISKRHTRFGEDRYREGIAQAVTSLSTFKTQEAERITCLRDRELSEDEANSRILQGYEKKVIPSRLLSAVISEWRSPSHDAFVQRNGWSLYNAFTEVIKPRFEKYPAKAALETMRFQKLLLA